MAKIHFLGTCSGTEPMKGMHHSSFILESQGLLYWFDAGEGCAYSAYIAGIDIMKTRAVFVSHPHIDHIGGFPHLLFCIEKLEVMHKRTLVSGNTLEVYFPDKEVFDAIKVVAQGSTTPEFSFELRDTVIKDGVIFYDGAIKVTAKHNRHIQVGGTDDVFHAFSFLIECEGKRIVFSGDVKSPDELDSFVNDADLLIMETGHHAVRDVCQYAISKRVRSLILNHHGREVLNDKDGSAKLIADYESASGIPMTLAYDGMTATL